MNKRIVFLDLDGVLADFDNAVPMEQRRDGFKKRQDPPCMFEPGFFRSLKPMPGAKEAVSELLADGRLDVYVGSKPTTKALGCASEKYQWVSEHFPALLRKMVLVRDKSLLRGDYLIDDDFDRWFGKFVGQFVHFDREKPQESWRKVVAILTAWTPA